MKFNSILRELRLERGYTQTQLANLAGLATSCIAMLETNQREPNANTLIALSMTFNVSTDYLLGLEDDFGARVVAPIGDELTYSSEERKLVEQYRSLPEQLKKLVRDQLTVYCSPNELLPKNNKKV